MSVCPDDSANLPIDIPCEGLLFGGSLSMEIHQNNIGLFAEPFNGRLPHCERAVQCRHKDTALNIQHPQAYTATAIANEDPGSGGGRRIVMRAQQPRLFCQVGQNRALVPDMVATCHQVDFGFEEILGDLRGNTETCGGIFNVGDAEIDAMLLDQTMQLVLDKPSPGFCEDVADKQ